MNAELLVPFFDKLCKIAANETLPRFRSRAQISNKKTSGFDPVTEADREAEKKIRDAIREAWPDHGIIGEEFGAHNDSAEYVWIIDPIDGTRSFISGIPLWGTLIGLYFNGMPLAGVLDQPFTGERFLCDGQTSFHQRSGVSTSMATSFIEKLPDATLMTTDPDLFNEDERFSFANLSNHCQLTRYGSDCYAYAMLASGNVDLVVESGLNFYDIAALVPIVEKAGGVFTDWKGNPNPKSGRVLVAANQALHEQAIQSLNRA